MTKSILILGGYGNFGKRISETLAQLSGVKIIIAGRNLEKANQLCSQLKQTGSTAELEAAALDINSNQFITSLKALNPFLVIHTSGPFQGQGYHVPQACISVGCHYLDLADDRRFVCDISSLHQAALEKDILLVSGASSVPGLSSTLIDHFYPQFSRLDNIDFAIAPGNKAERGEATVKAILSYTGHPIEIFKASKWQHEYGWMSARLMNFGGVVGKRWLANVDVPDLELFPSRYAPVKSVTFQAGLELGFLHWMLVGMGWLAKKRIVKNWAPYSRFIFNGGEIFKNLGTDIGGMKIELNGLDHQQQPLNICWNLFAEAGVGPYIPTLSTILLAEKLINEQLTTRGATPCLGLYSLAEFDVWAKRWGIYHTTHINGVEQPQA